MNLGSSVRSLSSKFNLTLRIFDSWNKTIDHKLSPALCVFSQVNKNSPNGKLDILYSYKTQSEPLCLIIPKSDMPTLKKIIEPEKRIKLEIPLINVTNKEVDLPCIVDREMIEPTNHIISKKALNILRIRAKKMKKHKYKKFMKKMRFEFSKAKQKKNLEKEMMFQTQLKEILKEKITFDAENHVKEILDKLNWVPPVTRARGRLAPQWVIKEELERKQRKKMYNERIKECIKEQN